VDSRGTPTSRRQRRSFEKTAIRKSGRWHGPCNSSGTTTNGQGNHTLMKVPKKCARTRKLPPWVGSRPYRRNPRASARGEDVKLEMGGGGVTTRQSTVHYSADIAGAPTSVLGALCFVDYADVGGSLGLRAELVWLPAGLISRSPLAVDGAPVGSFGLVGDGVLVTSLCASNKDRPPVGRRGVRRGIFGHDVDDRSARKSASSMTSFAAGSG